MNGKITEALQKYHDAEYKRLEVEQEIMDAQNEFIKAVEEEDSDIVSKLVTVIKALQYPRELYPCRGNDCCYECITVSNVTLYIIDQYGYIDIIGLSDGDFHRLNSILNPEEE